MSQKSTYLSGVKTIHHQSFTTLSQLYIQKHPMIIVKALREDFDNSITLSAESSLSVLSRSQTSEKSWKRSPNIQNYTHTLLHKPAFIPKYFSISQQKHLLIILLNRSFFMLRCSKTSLVEKNRLYRNRETRMEIQDERN